jgi:hypothetical protein
MKDRMWFVVFVFCLTSCGNNGKMPEMSEALTGNWLLLYPDHDTRTKAQNAFYASAQDSLVRLMGLKLVSFKPGGIFLQMDSLFTSSGRWELNTNEVSVKNGGTGWEQFNGRLIGFIKDSLRMVEYIHFNDDSVRVVWVLKKIRDDARASSLFEEAENRWREKPVRPQTDAELRNKLKQMLKYYSLYYELVSRESIYFTGSRVMLPFQYYQHGTGLMPYDEKHPFNRLFYNTADARRAYTMLEEIFDTENFPAGKDYVIEYAVFMKRLAEKL